MAGGNTGRRPSRKDKGGSTPSPTGGSTASTAAAVRAAAAKRRSSMPAPAAWVPAAGAARPELGEELDPTEPDDIEVWLAGQLRDWELRVGAKTLGQLNTILGQMLDAARTQREGVKNDLRAEGYLEGQINVLETVIQQVGRAVAARENRIGEDPRRGQ